MVPSGIRITDDSVFGCHFTKTGALPVYAGGVSQTEMSKSTSETRSKLGSKARSNRAAASRCPTEKAIMIINKTTARKAKGSRFGRPGDGMRTFKARVAAAMRSRCKAQSLCALASFSAPTNRSSRAVNGRCLKPLSISRRWRAASSLT